MKNRLLTPSRPSRREFLQQASAGSLGLLASCRGSGQKAAERPPGIPSHLPRRLAICYYGWEWIVYSSPAEPFGDLESMVVQTKDRGFNCIRAEVGLNWMFDLQGRRRGKISFLDWVSGASGNLHCFAYEIGRAHV